MSPPPIRFTYADGEVAHDAWRFNCGPAALCAILGKTPEEIRPHMGDFESKGHTNPTLMRAVLKSLGARFRWRTTRFFEPMKIGYEWPSFGLARVQWSGPWSALNVPPAAAYRYTHWIGVAHIASVWNVFDINAMAVDCRHDWNGWSTAADWVFVVVPAILASYPKADGTWWMTHAVEIQP